ncbi:expressed unknown protein [Seminavis robusta]|uniref:Uncharacterized protein n=1 Tax=Seminavis robusta TaxID=568900 RepID=A0A9N8HJ83_9STRA|nr:expressed unknown protein [Seminavis robusta]|eukprot:Sro748_g196630.1 n/a (715) ;mRNA; f:8422-10566
MGVTSSPESVPSLAASSHASTDGGDSLRMMEDELRSPASSAAATYKSSLSRNSSWRAILDDDEDEIQVQQEEDDIQLHDKVSTCSSGILSSETFDLSFDPNVFEAMDTDSLHSLASMKTLKSPSGRHWEDAGSADISPPDITDPETIVEDPEDVPVHRACHGALGISPRQLAEVFALFSKESKSKAKVSVEPTESQFHVEPAMAPPTRKLHADYPMSMEERQRYRRSGGGANQPKLTAELYWKPRAKSLEKECITLKEILSDDSNKILQLKGALDTLRNDKLRSLVDIKRYQDQLESTSKELDSVKKERDMLLEHDTEHRETIRILKHEVDILTREEKRHKPSKKKSSPPHRNSADKDLLEQLRLENQLFATQIVDYESELERLEKQVQCTTGKEQHDTREAMRAYELARSISQLERLNEQQAEEEEEMGADSAELEDHVLCLSQEPLSDEQYVETTLWSQEIDDIVVTASSMGEESILLGEGEGVDLIVGDEAVEEEDGIKSFTDGETSEAPKTADDRDTADQEMSLGNAFSGITNEFPQQIIGNVLGMFTVGGSTDDGNENSKDEIFVVHEAAPTSQPQADIAHCLQWKSPDELPTFVKVDRIVPIENVEDRNPPSSPSSSPGPLNDKTNLSSPSIRSVLKQHEKDRCGARDGTAIEVHHNSDASQSIEVQLTDSGKDKSRSGGVKTKCDENCDMWSALSGCPFASDDEHPN